MESMDKLWSKVDNVVETQIRHDERLKANENAIQRGMESIAKLEGELNEKFDALTLEIREGFKQTHERMNEIDSQKYQRHGYEQGIVDSRKTMYKQFGIWMSIASISVALITWWLTK